MNHFIKIHIILLNVIIAYTSNELRQNIETHTSITRDDFKKLIRRYPAFIQLPLQKQDYYNGKDVSRCPMPYNENTIIDDPDVVVNKFFNPRNCNKPWTWTYKNYIDVPVSVNSTVGQKLGIIIQPCHKENADIIQCYCHYLNVMESVGLTLIDRFCLFSLEIFNKLEKLEENIDYMQDFSLFEITFNMELVQKIIEESHELLKTISSSFKRYYISTLPLDCVDNALRKLASKKRTTKEYVIKCNKQIIYCRELMKSKKNYAVLNNDQHWQWDVTSDFTPDDSLIIHIQLANIQLGFKLFDSNE